MTSAISDHIPAHAEPGFEGELIRPSAAGYDEGRRLFNAMIDRRPAAIARCRTSAGVVGALSLARDEGLQLSVRAGGHGVAGLAIADGGLVIDVSPMKRVHVDPARRVAVAGAGLTWGELDAATVAAGLAVTGGRVSSTGIAGLTLGSGSGWLQRKHGFTADNLLGAEVVTAGGDIVQASAGENPELFWALRGGGGNFGVVTSFAYRVHPVQTLLGGLLFYRSESAPSVVRAWRDYMQEAPDEVGSVLVCISSVRNPSVPELWGRRALCVVASYFGPLDDGERVLRPLRELRGLAADLVEPMPYTTLQQLLDPIAVPGRHQYWKAEGLEELSDAAIDVCLGCAEETTSPYSLIVLEAKGGACQRVPEHATPLSRNAPFDYQAISIWEDPSEADRHIHWARRTWESLEAFSVPGVALNFTSDTGDRRVRTTFGPDKYRRLVAVKDAWDPNNVFSSNQNIAPSRIAGAVAA
jgi:FAD/FMN-containing dehydrogenase